MIAAPRSSACRASRPALAPPYRERQRKRRRARRGGLRRKAESDLENARSELEDARRTAIPALTDLKPPPFELHLSTRSVVTLGGVTAHFIGVTNPAGQPERRARVYLDGMEERPRNIVAPHTQYEPVIPYTLPPQGGGNRALRLRRGFRTL